MKESGLCRRHEACVLARQAIWQAAAEHARWRRPTRRSGTNQPRPRRGAHLEALARQARDAHWPYEESLHELLSAEQASRHESVIRQRLHEARFPEVKSYRMRKRRGREDPS